MARGVGMNTHTVRTMSTNVWANLDSIPDEDRCIDEGRYEAERTGWDLLESVLLATTRWRLGKDGVLLLEHGTGVTVSLDLLASMIVAVIEDEQHLVMSVNQSGICVAGEGIYHDVPMSDHLTSAVLLGEAGFPITHTPDTLYMLHSTEDLFARMEKDCFSLEERTAATKLLVSYVRQEQGKGPISDQAFRSSQTGDLPPEVELELAYSDLYPKFMPTMDRGGDAMVHQFLDLMLRLTRHMPDEPSPLLHRFLDAHMQMMTPKDQRGIRDGIRTLCEVSRPDLYPLYETADALYQNSWEFDRHHELHQEIVYLPPHLRVGHHEAPADAYANVHEVEDIMMF